FAVGDGNVQMNGGGNGQINGSLWVAKTWDASHNLLSDMGSPTFGWNGGGGNGMQYDHCKVSNLMSAVPLTNLTSTRPLKVLSYRALAYYAPRRGARHPGVRAEARDPREEIPGNPGRVLI